MEKEIHIGVKGQDRDDCINIYCGRGSPLGNPFIMKGEVSRDEVCDQYFEHFHGNVHNNTSSIYHEIRRVFRLSLDNNINLQCFCSPKRCHTETIRNSLIKAKKWYYQNNRIKVIVAGGRDFNDKGLMSDVLDKYAGYHANNVTIVSGGAKGADSLAVEYSKEKDLEVEVHNALWSDMSEPCQVGYNRHGTYNKLAGHNRNTRMANIADELIAFWDGKSKGTKNMIDTMIHLNKPVKVVDY